MLSVDAVIDLLNDQGKGYKCPPFINKWRGVYYGMSLHTTGACPAFRILNPGAKYGTDGAGGKGRTPQAGWTYPVGFYGWEYQQLFEIYLLNRHPREADETFQWRLSQYRPYTRTPFQMCMDVVAGAIFQDSNFNVTLEDVNDAAYINGNNFNDMDLISYIKSNFQWICEDPNGRFVTIPKEPYYATTTDKIEPRVYFIPSKNIISITDDEMIFNIHDIAWVANNIGYFRFKKDPNTGQYIHMDAANGGYYAHMMGRYPSVIAGGKWNTQGWFDSWLNAAKAVADDFVSSKSAEQLVNKEASHPFIVEASTDCPDCNAGLIQVACQVTPETPQGQQLIRCPRCGGSHTISHNPADRMIVPPDQMKEKLVQIINPDVEINKFHKENCQDLYDSMMEALHMNYIEQAQSGVAKDKDMETRYQFIINISNDLFDRIITRIIIDILSLRNVAVQGNNVVPAPTGFYITKPTQFQIKTASQLLDEYTVATKSQLPDYVRAKHVEDYVDKQFGGDEVLKKKTFLINRMDFLAVATEGDKQSRVLGGACANRDWQFSVVLPGLLDTVIREKGSEWFVAAKYDDVKALVDAAFKLIEPVLMVPKSETSQSKQTS